MKAQGHFAHTSACGRCTGNRTSTITSRHTSRRPDVRRASPGGREGRDPNNTARNLHHLDGPQATTATDCASIRIGSASYAATPAREGEPAAAHGVRHGLRAALCARWRSGRRRLCAARANGGAPLRRFAVLFHERSTTLACHGVRAANQLMAGSSMDVALTSKLVARRRRL